MRWLLAIILTLACSVASADDLIIYRLPGGLAIAVKTDGGKLEVVGVLGTFDNVTVIESNPTVPPPSVSKPTRAVYVYEKDSGATPPQVAGALNTINKQALEAGSGFVADEFEEDTVDGTGQVPDQFKVAREEALKVGLPCLVVLSGDKVVRTVKAPKTARDVEEAVKP